MSCFRPTIPLMRKAPARSWTRCRSTSRCAPTSPTTTRQSCSNSDRSSRATERQRGRPGTHSPQPLDNTRRIGPRLRGDHGGMLFRLNDPHRLTIEPGTDVLDDVRKIFPVVLLAHIAEMRRDDDIVHLTE